MNTIDFSEAVCKLIRTQLDHYLSNELSVETNHEVMKHLEACAACSDELGARMRVRHLLRHAVESEEASVVLRRRIASRIHEGEPPLSLHWFSSRWTFAGAAAVAIILGTVATLHWRANRLYDDRAAQDAYIRAIDARLPRVVAIGMADHLHCAVFRRFPQAYPKEPIADQDLGPKLVRLVAMVKERMPGEYRVVMAHRCSYAGRRYIHFVLKSGSKLVSLVITEKQPGESFGEMRSSAGPQLPVPVYQAQVKSFEVAGFESQDYWAFVVSDLDQQNNLQIADNVAPVVTELLNSMKG